MKKLIILVVLCTAVFGGYTWHLNKKTKTFATEMKKEYRGYRLEYFENEKLLFLHAPDGSKEGMPLDIKYIEQVFLSKTTASENTLNKDLYNWQIQYVTHPFPNDSHSWMRRWFAVPYFSLEPIEFLNIVKKEIRDIDIERSIQYAKQLERNEFIHCSIWAHPEYKTPAPINSLKECAH